jgi:hypothetical protein
MVAPSVVGSANALTLADLPPLDVGLVRLLGQEVDPGALQAVAVGEGGVYAPASRSWLPTSTPTSRRTSTLGWTS